MGLRINTNVEALAAHRHLLTTTNALSKSMQRLSSGLRINSAADDAVGMAISQQLRAQASGFAAAQRNAQSGISLAQIADGSLDQVQSILTRIRDLAVQYNNGVYTTNDKYAITLEVGSLQTELNRIIGDAKFNGISLLAPSAGSTTVTLAIGDGASGYLSFTLPDTSTDLGSEIGNFISAGTTTTVDVSAIDDAIDAISAERTTFASVQNRLESTIESLAAQQENVLAADSNIRDVDVAEEMANMARLQILQQSGSAMLAQANLLTAGALGLLGGTK
jgi:flagellin